MRRALLGAALLALLAPVALAAAVEREFVFAYGGGDDEVRVRVDALLPVWSATLLDTLQPGAEWNPKEAGDFDVVRRRTEVTLERVGPGVARAHVRLTDDTSLPSGTATTAAIVERIADELRVRIQQTGASARKGAVDLLVTRLAEADARARLLEFDLAQSTKKHPRPDSHLRSAEERLERVVSALADERIESAVTARQLEAARAAAERASEVRRLEDGVAAAEERLRAERNAANQATLGQVRKVLAAAAGKAPSLETARERVFDLEVALVAHESRAALLDAERQELEKSIGPMDQAARLYTERRAAQRAVAERVAAYRAQLEEERGRALCPLFERLDTAPTGPDGGR